METTKLTLEHLSVYLPYGLKIQIKDCYGIDFEFLTSLQRKDGFDIAQISNTDYYLCDEENDFSIKPILKSLSYFETIDEHPELSWQDIVSLRRLSRGNVILNNIPYHMIAIMAKEHFDVFGLIDAGLAINYFETI